MESYILTHSQASEYKKRRFSTKIWQEWSTWIQITDILDSRDLLYTYEDPYICHYEYISITLLCCCDGGLEVMVDADWEFFDMDLFDFTEPIYQLNMAKFPIPGTELVF